MFIKKEKFGTINGQEVNAFLLSQEGLTVRLIEYGAAIQSILVNGRDGREVPVALGYNTLEEYVNNSVFLGAICGRNANRIEGAGFRMNGLEYTLEKNDGNNNLHSGSNGFHGRIFSGKEIENGVEFSLESEPFDQGFPGRMQVTVQYTLTKENGIRISYQAQADEDTICNLTSHAYFNLEGKGSILHHDLLLSSDFYTPVDDACIPSGEILSVKGTPFDFTKGRRVGLSVEAGEDPVSNGYDHNFVLRGDTDQFAGRICAPESGVCMEIYTDMPGIQFYSGNFLAGYVFPDGTAGGKYSGFCLETQFFPDAVHYSHFKQPLLKANDVFTSFTEYRFV